MTIKIHTPKPSTHLPAHERAAAARRRRDAALPAIPATARHAHGNPKPRRKTFDTRVLNSRFGAS